MAAGVATVKIPATCVRLPPEFNTALERRNKPTVTNKVTKEAARASVVQFVYLSPLNVTRRVRRHTSAKEVTVNPRRSPIKTNGLRMYRAAKKRSKTLICGPAVIAR